MYLTPLNDYSFKAKIPNVKTVTNVVSDFVLPVQTIRQADAIGNVFSKAFTSLRNLQLQKSNDEAQLLLLEVMGKLGIKSIGETLQEGILLAQKDKNIRISVPQERALKVQTFDKESGDVLNSFFVHNQKLVKSSEKRGGKEVLAYYQKDEDGLGFALKEFSQSLDEVDFSVLKLRLAVEKPEVQREVAKFDPNQVVLAIRKSEIEAKSGYISSAGRNRADRSYVFHSRGKVTPEQKTVVEGIVSLFTSAHEKILGVKNMALRSKLKNGYGEVLEKGVAGSKELRFVGIGADGANVSVNMLNYQYEKNLIVKMTTKDGAEKYFIVNPMGEVIKEPPLMLKFGKQKNNADNVVEYYSQADLETFNMQEFLLPLYTELKKYNKYIDSGIEAMAARRVRYSTVEDIGSLLDVRPTIDAIEKNYLNYKKGVVTLSVKSRHKIADQLGFDVINRPCLIMRGVGENVEDLCLSFPVFEGQKGFKIQVLGEKDIVTKTFYIMNDKLMKFESDKILSKKHGGRKVYYYSKEEVEKSGVREYLKIVDAKLCDAMDVVTEHRNPATQKVLASLRQLKRKLTGHRKID